METEGRDRAWPFAAGGGATILLVSLAALALLALFWAVPAFWSGLLLAVGLVVWLIVLYFFRDPNRHSAVDAGVVLSPGDGKVVAITEEDETLYLGRRCRRISLFLSLTDVHVQRSPIAGTVAQVKRRPGKFLQAFRPEASDVNEHIAMTLETVYGPVLVKQIAGIVARRCVNHMAPGDVLRTGQRFGLIRFGSRVDLFLPLSAEIVAEIGEQAYGGLTPLARFSQSAVGTEETSP